MHANKWVANNKAINQQGWRLQKRITMCCTLFVFVPMLSLLPRSSCSTHTQTVVWLSFTIITVEFEFVCGCRAIALPFWFLSIHNRFSGFGMFEHHNEKASAYTHKTIGETNLIRCTHRSEYVKYIRIKQWTRNGSSLKSSRMKAKQSMHCVPYSTIFFVACFVFFTFFCCIW